MGKSVKLSDIAAQVGVSTVTVSKALSGKKGVSEEVRQKIVKLADELGYKTPSELNGTKEKSFNIGVLIHDMYLDNYDSFYLQMYQCLTKRAGSRNCFTLMEVVTERMEALKLLPKLITSGKCDGIVVVGKLDKDYLKIIEEESRIPVVYMDFATDRSDIYSVVSDNFYGSYYLTNYLLENGHRKIAFVGTINANNSIMDRYLGYRKSLLEHGIEVPADYRIDDRRLTGVIEEDLIRIPADHPSAFVCNCDLTASVLIKKLNKMGYSVPDDFSVVGYDNYLAPGVLDIRLTTYAVDMNEMAKRTINTMIRKLMNEHARTGIHVVGGKVIEGESVRNIGSGI
ncbi:MAG: LacI family DNA-binding transcriptional regulator [Saccharofermentans sp.]|nr:LacI family DNA-binding transcriptional regulator [Saccharofermentans sp.]